MLSYYCLQQLTIFHIYGRINTTEKTLQAEQFGNCFINQSCRRWEIQTIVPGRLELIPGPAVREQGKYVRQREMYILTIFFLFVTFGSFNVRPFSACNKWQA